MGFMHVDPDRVVRAARAEPDRDRHRRRAPRPPRRHRRPPGAARAASRRSSSTAGRPGPSPASATSPSWSRRRRWSPRPSTSRAIDARINIFAGFAAGTRAALDLDAVLAKGIYLFGTSGSGIPDMQAVLAKLERGELDTNISVDAVCGMEGVAEALAAVEARTSGGKIVVYPALHELGLVRLAELAERFPAAAAALAAMGAGPRAAEDALLAAAADGDRR